MSYSISLLSRAAVLTMLTGLLACGGSNPASPPTPAPPTTTLPPAPTTLADLSASVTSPEDGHTFGCRDSAHFKATITNRGATLVVVTGVKKHGSTVQGDCTPGGDFSYPFGVSALPHATTTITEQESLYSKGTGCCSGGPSCSGNCTFKEEFSVVTLLGDVPAGSFQYQVIFGNCGQCANVTADGQGACRLPAR